MWALLPSDLIIAVADRLPVADYARFLAVCIAWSSALKDLINPCTRSSSSSSFPWLYPKTATLDVDRFSFLDCSVDRYYRLSLPANICAARTTVRLVGQRDGWMVFLLRQDDNLRPIVVNPLSGTQLRLPSLVCPLPSEYLRDDSYTIIPYPAHNVAFLIYGIPSSRNLAFTGPGDFRWTHVNPRCTYVEELDTKQMQLIRGVHMNFKDVVYQDGRFYTICSSGMMLALKLDASTKASITDSTTASIVFLAENKYLSPNVNFRSWDVMFLVSSPTGDLLQIRTVEYRDWHASIVVMKYDAEADRWAEIQDLGDWCIFVDKCQAMLLPAKGNGDSTWPQLRRNCIYFAGSHRDESLPFWDNRAVWDVRIYEVGSSATGTPCCTFSTSKAYHPLLWFRPSFA